MTAFDNPKVSWYVTLVAFGLRFSSQQFTFGKLLIYRLIRQFHLILLPKLMRIVTSLTNKSWILKFALLSTS